MAGAVAEPPCQIPETRPAVQMFGQEPGDVRADGLTRGRRRIANGDLAYEDAEQPGHVVRRRRGRYLEQPLGGIFQGERSMSKRIGDSCSPARPTPKHGHSTERPSGLPHVRWTNGRALPVATSIANTSAAP